MGPGNQRLSERACCANRRRYDERLVSGAETSAQHRLRTVRLPIDVSQVTPGFVRDTNRRT
jgi:hypothetical protein